MVSLLLFVFAGLWLEGVLKSYMMFILSRILFSGARSLYQLDSEYRFTVIVTSLNVIEWSVVIAIPIVQVKMQYSSFKKFCNTRWYFYWEVKFFLSN